MPPTHRQLRELNDNGFLLAENFIDTSDVRKLIAEVESLSDKGQDTRTRRGVAFARRNLLDEAFVRTLIDRPLIRQWLGKISDDLIPVRAILFDKTGSANWTVPWHQDRSIAVRERRDVAGFGPWSVKAGVVHVQPPVDVLQRMVTLRMHLDPCGSDNGPLRVIGGTHRAVLDAAQVEAAVSTGRQTVCAVDAGGLVVMRPLILHASSPAAVVSHRRVIHVEFGPADLTGGLQWAAS